VPLVLAIEPDQRQAAIVKRIVREKVLADVSVVDSPDAAREAIRTSVPDVLLISALLSPRDEDELVAHLRTLDQAGHLQTHTIPQLASALRPGERRSSGGLLSAFRRKKKDPEVAPSGCDPDIFAEEIRSYLQRAADKKRELVDGAAHAGAADHAWRAAQPNTAAAFSNEPEPEAESVPSTGSSWASPFEWKPSNPASNPSSLIPDPESLVAQPESLISSPESRIAHSESPEPLTLMAHLRPPKDITVQEPLIVSAPVEVVVPAAAPVEVRSPEPTPMLEALPIQEAVLIQEEVPIQAPAPIEDAGSGIGDQGAGIGDQGSGIRDQGLGIRFGALASWARAERQNSAVAAQTDDLRALLNGLAVPSAVVAVGYGCGCRIRRVRVPPAREPRDSATSGPVILSRRALAEQREQNSRF
jgi:hypothetical protein